MAKSKSKPKSKKVIEEEEVIEQPVEDTDATSADIDVDVDAVESAVDVDVDASAADIDVDVDAATSSADVDAATSFADVKVEVATSSENIDAATSSVDVEAATSSADVDVDVDADDQPPQSKQAATDEGEDGGDEGDANVETAPKPPTPKVTMTTYVLLGLNWVAVPLFIVMLVYSHSTHEQYNYRTIYNFIRVYGLPLDAEETVTSISTETRPVVRLNAEQLKTAFSSRKPGFSPPGSEPFVAIEEPVSFHIRPSDMSDTLAKELFPDNPVKTQDAEIKRLQDSLPATIDTAAKDVVAKTKPEDKRGTVKKLLLPIAWDVWQVKRLNDKLDATKDDALDDMLLDAAQRRIYFDILAPLNIHRPGAEGDYKIEKIAAVDSYVMKFNDGDVKLEGYKIDDLKGFLLQRLKAALSDKYDPEVHRGKLWPTDANAMMRDNNERREVIAYILFTLGQVQVPIVKEYLLPKGLDRAQIVSGLNEFTNASIYFVTSQRMLQQRIAEAIRVDREGWIVTAKGKGELSRTNGFIDEYEAEVQRLIRIAENIDTAQKRIADLTVQRDHFTKLYAKRDQQQKDITKKLLSARQDTAKLDKELRELQKQLFDAQLELADAGARNFALEAEIRGIELDYIRKTKGAK